MAGAGEDPSDQRMPGVRGGTVPAGPESLADLAMPYPRNLDPVRADAVRSALDRLQLMQQEGVLLAMPEIMVRD